MTARSWQRIAGLVRKDLAELSRSPSAVVPPVLTAVASLVPAFLVTWVAPGLSGETLEESREFSKGAALAVQVIPELSALSGNALIEAFVFHQFMIFLLLVPVVGAMALAAHAIIGEKIGRTLEPLLATPMTTLELLVAKASAPFALALALMWATLLLYVIGAAVVAEPGVWRVLLGPRVLLLFFLLGPLVALLSLQLAVIVSSRVNDPRSAQQLSALVILPITAVFMAQLIGQFVLGTAAIVVSGLALCLINAGLTWLGISVFDRERILMRWK